MRQFQDLIVLVPFNCFEAAMDEEMASSLPAVDFQRNLAIFVIWSRHPKYVRASYVFLLLWSEFASASKRLEEILRVFCFNWFKVLPFSAPFCSGKKTIWVSTSWTIGKLRINRSLSCPIYLVARLITENLVQAKLVYQPRAQLPRF